MTFNKIYSIKLKTKLKLTAKDTNSQIATH